MTEPKAMLSLGAFGSGRSRSPALGSCLTSSILLFPSSKSSSSDLDKEINVDKVRASLQRREAGADKAVQVCKIRALQPSLALCPVAPAAPVATECGRSCVLTAGGDTSCLQPPPLHPPPLSLSFIP